MVKRQKRILVWIITWAGLLMVVLYSPIGSPDLYSSKQYFTANQGVMFTNREILNSPTFKTVIDNNVHVIAVPVYVPELKNNASYSVKHSDDKHDIAAVKDYNHPLSFQKTQNSANIGIIGNIGTFKGSTSQQNNASQNNELYTLSTDLNLFGDNNRFSLNNDITKPSTTDPGGDPFGPPIPVPDGWGFLLAMAAGYAFYKKIFSRH